jgi:hypothetical protein
MQEKSSHLELAPVIVFEHMHRQRLTAGRLMSPFEVKESLAGRSDVPEEVAGWFICGDVHPEMYRAIAAEGGGLEHEVVLFPTASGLQFLALSQCAGEWEHRFVLPLVGNAARDFAQSLMSQPLRISLSSQSEELSVISEITVSRKNVVACIEAVCDLDAPVGRLFQEFAAATVALSVPHTMPSVGAGVLSHRRICVTLVAYPAIEQALARQFPMPAPGQRH